MKSLVKVGDNRLEMTRIFDAPRQRVFDAWKRPELLQQWWGCRATTRVEAQIEFRTGGLFAYQMDVQGAGQMAFTGIYDEIIEPEKIAYHADFAGCSSRVTIEFIDMGDRTKLILTQVGFPAPGICQIVSEGTSEALDKLEEMLALQTA